LYYYRSQAFGSKEAKQLDKTNYIRFVYRAQEPKENNTEDKEGDLDDRVRNAIDVFNIQYFTFT
jgi:hypothetical protein